MFRFVLPLIAALCLLAPFEAKAAAKPEMITTSNGQTLKVYRNDFKAEVEYTPPRIEMRDGWYTFTLRRSTKTGEKSFLIDGLIRYRTPWRFYNIAVLRGGEPANISTLRKEVGKCSAFNGQCIVAELYQVEVSEEQFEEGLAAGKLEVQISSSVAGGEFVITIPAAQLMATKELSEKEAQAGK